MFSNGELNVTAIISANSNKTSSLVFHNIYLTCSITSLCIFKVSRSALLLLAWLGIRSPPTLAAPPDDVMAEIPENADESLLPELLRLPRLRLVFLPLLPPLPVKLPFRLKLLELKRGT